MKRSSFLKPGKPLARITPMKRSAFKRPERKEGAAVARIRIKSRRPKMTPIRRAARGQECTLNLPGCLRNTETTVLCHSNSLADGKGMGLKAPDSCAAFGCAACHDLLDGRRTRPAGMSKEDVDRAFRLGVTRTHQILARMGLLKEAA